MTQQTTTHEQERPPLGSSEAIAKIVEALLESRRESRRGELWDHPFGLRANKLELWPFLLRVTHFLDFEPHYLEIIEALRELGWVYIWGPRTDTPAGTSVDLTSPDIKKKYPEDFFQEYVAGVRKREMKQRRALALRRRRGY